MNNDPQHASDTFNNKTAGLKNKKKSSHLNKKRGNGEGAMQNAQSDPCENNRLPEDLFRQIKIAKKEWEKTMDCLGDMIILTDSDGIIKRVNRSVKDFTGKPFKKIIGTTWEDLIIENELEAMTLFAGCTELRHRPTQRWFELHAYPFDSSELGFSGNVLTLHETTEVRNITEKLEKSNREVERNRKNLQIALNEICSLIENVIQMKDNSVRFHNPHLVKCYEIKNCDKEDCHCFGMNAMRCWQVAGTFCGGEAQGTFAQKYVSCVECEVYKAATADPIYQIGEHFNNMMHILEMRGKALATSEIIKK